MEDGIYKTLVTGYVIYQYDFTNEKGNHIQTGKGIFAVHGVTLYLTSRLLVGKEVGSKVQVILGFDGKNWKILEVK